MKKLVDKPDHVASAFDRHAIVSIADAGGDITYVNDRFCEISGYRREELLGQNHSKIRSGKHSRDFYLDLWQTILRGDVWRGEICNRRKHGGYYWVDSTIVPFMDDAGTPFEYVCIRTDITRAKETERELARLSRALRAPITAILGCSQSLENDGTLSGEIRESVRDIVAAGKHLLQLVDDAPDAAGRRTVLYIEDDPANLKLVQRVVAARRHLRLLTADTPELGIELAMRHRPDVILLDISLPGMSGYQVLDVFNASDVLGDVPVIAVTASAMPDDIERGRRAGFAEYLTKPLDLHGFVTVLDKVLQSTGD